VLTVFALTGALPASAARATLAAQEARPTMTRTVDLDGITIRVRTAGLEDRVTGRPVIVLESGGATPLETWDPVLPELARLAPVIAYDRSGTGESEWDGVPPAPARVTARLRRLLDHLDVAPPWMLIGHSWGGGLVRSHAGAHPDDIAAILYIDPTDVTLRRADLIALFEELGAGAAEYDAFSAAMLQMLVGAPPAMRAESEVILDLLIAPADSSAVAPAVPTSVIVAGRVVAPPQRLLPFDAQAYADAMQRNRRARLQTWVRNGGRFEVATDAGHFVHADAPQLVINEVRRLLQSLRPH
jgi:pimeloyl-ACP methyl ester carboxylesterase